MNVVDRFYPWFELAKNLCITERGFLNAVNRWKTSSSLTCRMSCTRRSVVDWPGETPHL